MKNPDPQQYFSRIFFYHPKIRPSCFKSWKEWSKHIRLLNKALAIKLSDHIALCSISLPNFTEQYPFFMVWDRNPIEESRMWQFRTLVEAYQAADEFPIDEEYKIFLIAQWEDKDTIQMLCNRLYTPTKSSL